ncbi:MAG: LysR family transcriptional regulator [Novosphingobium sp. 28-62-57]|uniref:LysR family transcriptional regulator n=1 Tax=unclassified Novosphingobium TaxID=2644732 RepID=UPI000BD237C5|nr:MULTISPECIES: LysR family transcriptional regulator [unclassified Novosphingobium]OYW49257.1 MAG: LysR family transcriptional regulator [Novosphingobium sp. 12-62-10]OYZ09716.1 MAG: LysR family transcriptional regulator [Novosphingobium sp. 28-62-57]OZA36826.1 MAG: LysR family transcriptional regulator [Novosphingobium sp. 17-62-9]HQS68392.1 LysR family transcriptional regulator [Novosphingobium sp.]
MRFKGLDLNLLVAFNVLMETRSVSRAAEKLHLSQPAMSAALGRLREYFGDDLLVLTGKRMLPTAYAETLVPMVQETLRQVDALITTSTVFDPATSQRTFRLIASDYITAAVIAPLSRRLSQEAPGIQLESVLPSDGSADLIAQGAFDLLITPEDFINPGQPAELLFEERHVIVGWDRNSVFAGDVTEAVFMAAGQVGVQMGNQRTSAFADRTMEQMGRFRRMEVTASSFTVVPWLVIETNRLAVMHERLARRMATMFPLAIAPIPFDFPIMREMLQFNRTRSNDEGLKWLRNQLRQESALPDANNSSDTFQSKQ